MAGVLSHIRVLDLTRYLAGPWATQMLADLGAEVIKVERPRQGDFVRTYGPPFIKDKNGHETRESPFFVGFNRGKKSVTIDISTQEGQRIVRQLAAKCDVLIENYIVGTLQRYGLGYEDMKAIRPDIVYCSITGYGQDGPYRDRAGFDPIIQATAGLMSINGVPDGEPGARPLKVGTAVIDVMTGMNATIAILGALNHRSVSGQGQYIDIALLDVAVAALTSENMRYLQLGQIAQRPGDSSRNLAPSQTFKCKDGLLSLAIASDDQFVKFMKIMGRPEVARDERFAKNAARLRNRPVLIAMLEEIFLTRPVREWVELIASAAIPCGPVNNIKEVFEDPQVRHRRMRVEIDHPVLGTTPVVANPIRYSATPIEYQIAPPMLGQHTREVLREFAHIEGEQFERLAQKGVI
ncbi:MAG: CoA transferase [Betaproteobacteria bacterium]|nr:CoA transferase [Betaproteobacteria bacterium]